MSITVIVWEYREEFSDESVATHVTIVSPIWNNSGASLIMLGFWSTSSNADAWPISTVIPDMSVISKVISSGPVITGWIVSSIIIRCVSEAEFPEVSVAVQVTIVSPSGKNSGASFSTDSISTLSKILPFDNST